MDILEADFDMKYDLIVCSEILYYLNRRQIHKIIRIIHKYLESGGYLLIGNIKQIQSNKGFFRGHINGDEITKLLKEAGIFDVITEYDRGGDILTLLCRRP